MKPYINNAIIGNSRILATLDDKSQFIRIFWPTIDYSEHIEKMLLGICFPNVSNSMHWFDQHDWNYSQHYIDDTNILRTVIENESYGIKISLTDFALIDKDVLVRNIVFENISNIEQEFSFAVFCKGTTSADNQCSTIFDFESDSTIFCRHNDYMFLSSSKECKQFQLTNNPFNTCNNLNLCGVEEISLSSEGAMNWEFGKLAPGAKTEMNLYIAFGENINNTREMLSEIKKEHYKKLYVDTKTYWHEFLKSAKQIKTGKFDLDSLYKRSLLAMKLMCDQNGGIIAAPEVDEEYNKCGRYGYVWGRDAGFITTAFERVGLIDISRNFYKWAIKAQNSNGAWYQRYYVDGNVAPGWGLQTDETATIIWGMWQHYITTKDIGFLHDVWYSVYIGSEYLTKMIDRNNGMPSLCYDLWENRLGEHTYTASAIYGALIAAHNIAKELNKETFLIEKWYIEAQNIKKTIDEKMWDENLDRFIRSINVKLNPWGNECGEAINIVVNKKCNIRDFTLKDLVLDASLIGLVVPFETFDENNEKIKKTIKAIEELLTSKNIGGILRYEYDDYIGGNPWIITTLWLASYYIKTKQFDLAKNLLVWSSNHKTKLGFLPEQVDKETGDAAWIVPLTWSHAMYIHVLLDLVENDKI